MLVYTTTKKRALRLIAIILTLFMGIAIGAAAILNAINANAAQRKVPVYCVDRGDNLVSLTFDCAWGNSNTDELLAILKENNVKATFFVTGEFCDAYAKDVLKIFQAGHEIQNHSDKHIHPKGININDLIADTKECSRKIRMITGVEPDLYRAPYGEYDDNVITTLEGMGFQVVQWSVDSIDWEQPSSETIISRVTENTSSGDILLFHNDLENTTAALPEIITKLRQKGFSFVTANELIYDDSYHIDSSGKQIYEVKVSESAFTAYTSNSIMNAALETMRLNLSSEEIYSLTQGADVNVIDKITPLLTKEQITLIQSMSYEELKEAINSLVAVVNKYGAGGDNPTPAAQTTNENDETSPAETTTGGEEAPETTTTPANKDDPPVSTAQTTVQTTTAGGTEEAKG